MHEYLLSIAEKIINDACPPDIALKYYELKKSIVLKSRSTSKMTTKPTSNMNRLNGKDELHTIREKCIKNSLSKMKFDSVSALTTADRERSKSTKPTRAKIPEVSPLRVKNEEINKQTRCNIKNVSIDVPRISFDKSMTNKENKENINLTMQQTQVQNKNALQEIKSDNKWLIQQLDKIIKENNLLRKIIDKKIV